MILNLNVLIVSQVVVGIIAFLLMGYVSFKMTNKGFAVLEGVKGYEDFIPLILFYIIMLLLALYPIPYLRDLAEALKNGIQGNLVSLILALIVIPLSIHFIITPLVLGMFTLYVKKLSQTTEDNKLVLILISLMIFLAILFISLKVSPTIWESIGVY